MSSSEQESVESNKTVDMNSDQNNSDLNNVNQNNSDLNNVDQNNLNQNDDVHQNNLTSNQMNDKSVNFKDDNQIKQILIDDFTEPFDDEETAEQRKGRKNQIERNIHNQKAYYDQKNNIESDEASDNIQSDLDSKSGGLTTYDEKMKQMVKMFIESFVPFNLLHGDYFSNILRNSFGIRKMPKLIQFKNLFQIMYELGCKYICQTVSGSQSYSLIFEFWKTTNRRHQYVTVRIAYIDVFVKRTPILTSFKVFPDWSSDKYIDKFNYIFRRFKLERTKVISVITNFKARSFLSAVDLYIGSNKIIYCLIHQLNNKFNELLLDCDYDEDKIHYEQELKPLDEVEQIENGDDLNVDQDNEDQDSEDQNNEYQDNEDQIDYRSDEGNFFSDDDFIDDDKSADDEKVNENIDDENQTDCDLNGEEDKLEEEKLEDEDEEDFLEDGSFAYVKLFEEPKDVLRALNKQNLNEKSTTVKVIKSLIKTFAYISTKQELLDELNEITKKKNGHEFELFYLLSYKNWNYLHQFLFYFQMIRPEFAEFVLQHKDIPYELNENELEIVDDIFVLIAFLVRKLNFMSLEESIGLGKTLNIMKYFINTLPKLVLKTEEGNKLRQRFADFFDLKHGVFERDQFYGIASLLDPKSTKYDFKTDQTFKNALRNLHEMLCFRLDKDFNLTLFRIRAPLRIEIENFHKRRPYRGGNDITKFQLNSPVLQGLVYDYFTLSAICFEPKKIEFRVKESITECLSQIRSDTLSKVQLLNSLDGEVLDRIIEHAKFW